MRRAFLVAAVLAVSACLALLAASAPQVSAVVSPLAAKKVVKVQGRWNLPSFIN